MALFCTTTPVISDLWPHEVVFGMTENYRKLPKTQKHVSGDRFDASLQKKFPASWVD